jgi:cell division protein FtsQ
LRVVIATAVVAALAASVWGVAQSPVLDVDQVIVAGAERSGGDAVRAAGGLRPGRAMNEVDEAAVARRIEQLAWVRSAVVRREWPGTVHVAVVERQPVAVTRTFGDQWGLLDASGRVLAWSPQRPGDLPWVAGATPAGEPATQVDRATAKLIPVAQALPAGLASRVAAIVALGPEVELFLLPQGLVRLGPPDRAPAKLSVAEAVLSQVGPAESVAIDARFPSTAVLTRA